MKFRRGSKIQWKWAGRTIDGVVEDVFTESTTRTIKGSKITRHGSPANPAYLVRAESGATALKLGTELQARAKAKGPRPTMFS